MAARLEGIIELLVECLQLQPAPDSVRIELYSASLAALAAYCRTSDNNLRIVARKHGLELLGPMLNFACSMQGSISASDTVKLHCRKLAAAALLMGTYAFKNAAYVAVLLEDNAFATQVVHAAAVFLAAPIVTKTSIALLCTLAGKGAARVLWSKQAPHLLWKAVTLYSSADGMDTPILTLPGAAIDASASPENVIWVSPPTAAQSKAVMKSATGALWVLLSDPPDDVLYLSSLPPLTQDVCTPMAARYSLPSAPATQLQALEPRNAQLFSPATFSRYHPQTLSNHGTEQCTHQVALHLGEGAVSSPLPPGLLITSSIGPGGATRGPAGVNMNATRVWALPTQYLHTLPSSLETALANAATGASMWGRPAAQAGTVANVAARSALPWYLAFPGAWKMLILPHLTAQSSPLPDTGAAAGGEAAGSAEAANAPTPSSYVSGDSSHAVLQAALSLAAVAHPRTLSPACNLGPGARPFPEADAAFVSRASALLSEAAGAAVGQLQGRPRADKTSGSLLGSEGDVGTEAASPRSESSFTLPSIQVGGNSPSVPSVTASVGMPYEASPAAPLSAPLTISTAAIGHEPQAGSASVPTSPLVSSIRGVQRLRSDRSGAALVTMGALKLAPSVSTALSPAGRAGDAAASAQSRPSTAGTDGPVLCIPQAQLPVPEALPYNGNAELWAHVPHWFPELQLAAVSDVAQRMGPPEADTQAAANDAPVLSHMDVLRVHFPHIAPEGWVPPPGLEGLHPPAWAWYAAQDPSHRAVLLPALPALASDAGMSALQACPLAAPVSSVPVHSTRPTAFPAAEAQPNHPPHLFITPTGIVATRAWVIPASCLPSVLQAAPTAPLALEHMVSVALEQRQSIAQKLVLQAVARIVRDMGLVGSASDVALRRATNARSLVYNVYSESTGVGACTVQGVQQGLPFAVPSAHWAGVCAAYATQIYDTELGGEVSPPLPLSQLAVPLLKGAAQRKSKLKKKSSKAKPKPSKRTSGAKSAGDDSGLENASAAAEEEEEGEGDGEERETTAAEDDDDVASMASDDDMAVDEEDVQDREDADDDGAVVATPDALRRASRTPGASPVASPLPLQGGGLELSASMEGDGNPGNLSPGGELRAAALQDTDEDTLARAMALQVDLTGPDMLGQSGISAEPGAVDGADVPALAFESRFESGNLRCAARVGPREYELVLEPDTNTCRHTQWFYFATSGMQCAADHSVLWGTAAPGPEYVFHLVNLEKTDSSYNHGMRPVVFFVKDGEEQSEMWDLWANHEGGGVVPPPSALQEYTVLHSQRRLWLPPIPGCGWRRAGGGIVYYQNHYSKVKQMPLLSRAEVQSAVEGGGAEGAEEQQDDEDEEGDSDGAEGPSTSADGAAPVSRLYSETFRVVFPPGTKAAFFAYCFPYTYTDLGLDVQRWQWRAQRVSQGAYVGITDFAHPKDSWSCRDAGEEANAPASAAELHARQDGDNELCAYKHAGRHTAADMHRTLPQPAAATLGALRPEGSLFSSGIMVRSVLCHSIAGNALPLLTITDFKQPVLPVLPSPAAPLPLSNVPLHARPTIVLSARVHPGETNASWMIRGALDVLTSSAPIAQQARGRAVWKVVPFLNPDGVLNGHHRTNLAGVDLNRHWSTPTPAVAPTVWHLKRLLHAVQRRGRLVLYCDFHGHSRRKNVFTFGCEVTVASAGPAAAKEAEGWSAWVQKMFPALLAARADDFAMKNCSFKVQKSKANCARVAAWRDTPVVNSFTIEASFAGADEGANEGVHFSTRNFEEMGHHFVASLTDLMHFYNTVPTAGATAGVAPAMPIAPHALEALLSLPADTARAAAQAAAAVGVRSVPACVQRLPRLEQPEALLGSMLRQSGVPVAGLAAIGLCPPPPKCADLSAADAAAQALLELHGPHSSTWPYVLPVQAGQEASEHCDSVNDVLSTSLAGYAETSSGEVPFPWNLALDPLRRVPPAAVAQLMQAIKAAPKRRQAPLSTVLGAATAQSSGGPVRSLPPKAPTAPSGGDRTPGSSRRRPSLGQSRSAINLRSLSLSMGSSGTPRAAADDLSSGGLGWVQDLTAAGGSRVPMVAPVARAAGVAAALAKAVAAAAKKGPRKRAGAGKKRGSAKAPRGGKSARGGSKKKAPIRRKKKAA